MPQYSSLSPIASVVNVRPITLLSSRSGSPASSLLSHYSRCPVCSSSAARSPSLRRTVSTKVSQDYDSPLLYTPSSTSSSFAFISTLGLCTLIVVVADSSYSYTAAAAYKTSSGWMSPCVIVAALLFNTTL